MTKKLTKKRIKDVKKSESFKIEDTFGNIKKIVFPSDIQIGIPGSQFNSTISGSIHHTHEGKSFLVAGDGIIITSGSNGQVTIKSNITEVEGVAGQDGQPGEDGSAITYNLTPLSIALAADSSGIVSDYSICDTTLSVYENGSSLSYNNTLGNSQWKITGVTTSGITYTNNKSISSGVAHFVDHLSDMTSSNATVTYNIAVKNKFGTQTSYSLVQTLSKSLQGSDGDPGETGPKGDPGDTGPSGSDGVSYEVSLEPTHVLLAANSSGGVTNYAPTADTRIKVYKNGNILTPVDSLSPGIDRWVVSNVSDDYITKGSLSYDITNKKADTTSYSNMIADVASVSYEVKINLGSTGLYTYRDVIQTIAKVKQGVTGTAGKDGTDGTDGADGVATSNDVLYSLNTQEADLPLTYGTNSQPKSGGQYTDYYTTSWNNVIYDNTSDIDLDLATGIISLNTSGIYKINITILLTNVNGIQDGTDYKMIVTLQEDYEDKTGLHTLKHVQTPFDSVSLDNVVSSGTLTISDLYVVVDDKSRPEAQTFTLYTQINKGPTNSADPYGVAATSSNIESTISIEKVS